MSDFPAYPTHGFMVDASGAVTDVTVKAPGMSYRQHVAALMMPICVQAKLLECAGQYKANPSAFSGVDEDALSAAIMTGAAASAVEAADTLIAALKSGPSCGAA